MEKEHLPTAPTTTLGTLFGEDVVENTLVNEAVEWIRATLIRTLHKGMTEIGDHVFDKFFGGDPERVRSKAHNKNASFRSLLERCDSVEMPLRKTALYQAVASAAMRRLLPSRDAAFKKLSPSHQAALLPLREPERVEMLASRVLRESLSVRDARVAVGWDIESEKNNEHGGRRKKPLIAKTLGRSVALFTLEDGRRFFTKAQVKELNDVEVKVALASAQDLIDKLQKLVAQLEARS